MSGSVDQRRPVLTQTALGFVAGYVDTVSFFALGGIFVTMITGNIVLVGSSILTAPNARLLPNLLTVPVFVGAVALHSAIRRTTVFSAMSALLRARTLLCLQAALLAAFAAAGAALSSRSFPMRGDWEVSLVASLGVFAMAVQNAFTRLVGSSEPPTTIMTGNLVQVTMSLVDFSIAARKDDRESRTKALASLRAMLPGLLGFLSGAACAAPLVALLGFHALWVACAILLALAASPG